ncbi:MAG: IS110 family transposase [Chloroflexi bacterium]|nr:IS110 family transposase [Chloroflexota bacterium]
MPDKRINLPKTNRHGTTPKLKLRTMGKIKQKREEVKRISQLPVIRSMAAGIDVSDTEMMVAYPINSEQLEIRVFGCFTSDLHHIAKCLKRNAITSVAMESTGVYWVALYLLLEEYGFEVCLVNAKHVKNVTGRKDDESDAEWIQKLHSCGLLQASFQPDVITRTLREMVRHRKNMVQVSSGYLNRMQKALELMNIKLHTVISDIDGKTGIAIIEAILSGERDPEILVELRDRRIKATREELIKSLEGHYTKEHLFELRQCYQLYCYHRQLIVECDIEIEGLLNEQIASRNEGVLPDIPRVKRKAAGKNKIQFNAASYLNELLGVDITEVCGISELTALTILSEVGTDMTKWKTEHHFTSWLGLAPNTKISGGKVISSKIKKKKHHAGQAFRTAANSLYRSENPLGNYYRRIKAKAGAGKAVVATARKLAVIVYKMISNKEAFNPKAMVEYQEKYKEKKITQLKRKLALLEAA